jgi:hypothetical protein
MQKELTPVYSKTSHGVEIITHFVGFTKTGRYAEFVLDDPENEFSSMLGALIVDGEPNCMSRCSLPVAQRMLGDL